MLCYYYVLLYHHLRQSIIFTVQNFYSTKRLIERAHEWEKSQSTLEAAQYVGYVGAIFDYLSIARRICTVDEVTKNDVIISVTDELKSLEKGLDYSGAANVEKILIRTYRCQ